MARWRQWYYTGSVDRLWLQSAVISFVLIGFEWPSTHWYMGGVSKTQNTKYFTSTSKVTILYKVEFFRAHRFKSSWGFQKRPPGQNIQYFTDGIFSWLIMVNMDSNFTTVLLSVKDWLDVSNDSCNGLAQRRWQTINWFNDDKALWRSMESIRHSESYSL